MPCRTEARSSSELENGKDLAGEASWCVQNVYVRDHVHATALPLADAHGDGRRDKDAIGHSYVPKQQNELLYGTVYYLYTITYSYSQIAPADS